MRCELLGLALVPLMVCGSLASEAQAPNSVSAEPQQTQTNAQPPSSPAGPSRPGAMHDAKSSKKVSGRHVLPSLAAAHASEHYDGNPVSPAPKSAPATHSWTGIYVGAGVGAGTTQP